MLNSILWSKMFHADLDSSNHTPDIDALLDDLNYRTYVLRCCLVKLRSISSLGMKHYFDAENMRQEKLQMILIDFHTWEWRVGLAFRLNSRDLLAYSIKLWRKMWTYPWRNRFYNCWSKFGKSLSIIFVEQRPWWSIIRWKHSAVIPMRSIRISATAKRTLRQLALPKASKYSNCPSREITLRIFQAIYKRIEDEYNRMIENAGIDGSTIKTSGCLKALIYVADILELALKDGEHIDRNEYQSFAEWASSTCMQGKYGREKMIHSKRINRESFPS